MMRFLRTKVLLLTVVLAVFAQGGAAAIAQGQTGAQTPTPQPTGQTLVYGLVVDNTGSFRTVLDDVIEAGKTVVAGNKADDEAFLIRFVDSDNIQLVHDFTRNKNALGRALESMYVEGGATAIADALYVAAEHLAQKQGGQHSSPRRALILISDGDDRASAYKPDKLLAFLREKKIEVYVLGLPGMVKRERGKKSYEKALAFINTLAQETGGRVLLAERPSDLSARAAELVNILHGK